MLTGKSWLRIPKPKEGDPAKSLPKVMGAAGYETFHVGTASELASEFAAHPPRGECTVLVSA